MWSKYKLYFLLGFGALVIAAGVYFYRKNKKKASVTSEVASIPDGNTMNTNETHAIKKSLALINQN